MCGPLDAVSRLRETDFDARNVSKWLVQGGRKVNVRSYAERVFLGAVTARSEMELLASNLRKEIDVLDEVALSCHRVLFSICPITYLYGNDRDRRHIEAEPAKADYCGWLQSA